MAGAPSEARSLPTFFIHLFFPADCISAESQTKHLYGLRHRFVSPGYTATQPLFCHRRAAEAIGSLPLARSRGERAPARGLLAIQIGGNFLSAFLTSCIGLLFVSSDSPAAETLRPY